MIRKTISLLLVYACIGGLFIKCTESISDCPSKMCILASENGWQLKEVYEDGVKQTDDFSNYRITLSLPDDKATEGNFIRTNTGGKEDAGIWKTENLDEVLVLIPDTKPEEPYIIESFTPRELVLVINRESQKVGGLQLKYVFEPFN